MATALDTVRQLKNAAQRAAERGKDQGVVARDLRLDQLVPDPDQPRRDFERQADDDSTDSIEGLAETMRQVGVIVPLTVLDQGDGTYLIQTGERRYRAAKLAELETVPCLIVKPTVNTPLVQLIENLQRLSLRPLETARALEKALAELDINQAELAKRIGKSTTWVSKHINLLSASEATREALDKGQLTSVENARLFSQLPASDQRNMLLSDEPVTRTKLEIAHQDLAVAKSESAEPAPPEPRRPGRQKKVASPPPGLIYPPPLTVWQVERLFLRLGIPLPAEALNSRNVAQILLELLKPE